MRIWPDLEAPAVARWIVRRMEEAAFAEGRGPNLATKDKTIGNSGASEDPLEIPR